MMTPKYLFQLICLLLWLIEPLAAATPSLAKPGCNDTCGNGVTIPYPFGIGSPDCFLNEWYQVVCKDSRPYLSKYYGQEFGGEVIGVSLDPQTVTINNNVSNISLCVGKGMWLAGNLSGSPFFYNFLSVNVLGCGNFMLFEDKKVLRGCTATCDQNYSNTNGCYGINCCELMVPSYLQDISLNFSSSSVNRNNSCAAVIFKNYEGNSDILENQSLVVLEWVIRAPGLQQWQINGQYCTEQYSQNIGYYYTCNCRSSCSEGNPYIGCQVNPNCSPTFLPTSSSRENLVALVVGGTSFGVVSLGIVCFFSYKTISKRRERKLREKFFRKNGGLLLRQQLSVDENMVDKVKLFTSNELNKATDYFNRNRILGDGGQGTVYKGMLVDGKTVAIKKSKLANENQVEQFINEVVVLSQINHRNVVKLLGCCLETNVPLLVYEFIPNGTLYDLIHNENDGLVMSWNMRLRIAIEISEALAYLHSAISVSIYHRDIKSSNILLDEKYKAKISDFGISRHVTIGKTHLTTMVKGTFGYLDPEYFQSGQFTEKSDVYSFGVVLVELLTKRKPVSSSQSDEESFLSLATRFLISMEENSLKTILDTQILDTTNENQVTAVAILAYRCLSLDGRKRPPMKEVVMELESIKMSSVTQKDLQGNRDTEKQLVSFSDVIATSTIANDTIASSLDVYPLLIHTF